MTLLRDYEILYVVRPDLDEQQLGEAVASVNQLIGNLGGTAQKTDVWGRRRLAYEVRHLREGQYVLTDFQIEPARVPEMEATLKISDSVFRHLIVRKPELSSRRSSAARGGAAAGAAEAAEAKETAAVAEAAGAAQPSQPTQAQEQPAAEPGPPEPEQAPAEESRS